MYKIAICDDENIICSEIERIILEYQNNVIPLEIDIYYSGEEFYRFLSEGLQYDLIFLDIELIHMNGVTVGKKIRKELADDITQIVYISAKQEYAMELFETRPLNFLIKPISKDNVINTLNKALSLANMGEEVFKFKHGKNYYRIPVKDILYFESHNKMIKVVTVKKTDQFYGKISDIQKLLHSKEFTLIHKSYLINILYISEYRYESVKLTNGVELPISLPYRKETRQKLLFSEKEKQQL